MRRGLFELTDFTTVGNWYPDSSVSNQQPPPELLGAQHRLLLCRASSSPGASLDRGPGHSPRIFFSCMMEELARMRCIDCSPLGDSPSSNTSSYLSVGLPAAILVAIKDETKCQWPREGCQEMTGDLSYDGQLAGCCTYLAPSSLLGWGQLALLALLVVPKYLVTRIQLQAALGSFQFCRDLCPDGSPAYLWAPCRSYGPGFVAIPPRYAKDIAADTG